MKVCFGYKGIDDETSIDERGSFGRLAEFLYWWMRSAQSFIRWGIKQGHPSPKAKSFMQQKTVDGAVDVLWGFSGTSV